MADSFNLCWDFFESYTLASIKELLTDEAFTDVTLACDDGKQLKAHKVIVSACSPFLRKILQHNPHPHPLLYLSNISWINLNKLVQFMYLGKVEVQEQGLKSFMMDANKLKIKGLDTYEECLSNTAKIAQTESDFLATYARTNVEAKIESSVNKEDERAKKVENYQPNYSELGNNVLILEDISTLDIFDNGIGTEYVTDTMLGPPVLGKNGKLHYCEQCEYKSTKAYNVKKHTMSMHDGIRYPCSHCDYKATENGHLKKHIRRFHS